MKRLRQLGLLTAGLILTSLSFSVAGEAIKSADKAEKAVPDKINWMRYDEAVKVAREQNKHVFVDFTAVWCGWCKRLEKDTFSQPEVIKMLNENFVSTKVWDDKKDTLNIDGYKIVEKDLGRAQFGVKSYPTLWFLSPDGQKIGPIKGYLKAPDFMKALKYVKNYQYLVASADKEKTEVKTKD